MPAVVLIRLLVYDEAAQTLHDSTFVVESVIFVLYLLFLILMLLNHSVKVIIIAVVCVDNVQLNLDLAL